MKRIIVILLLAGMVSAQTPQCLSVSFAQKSIACDITKRGDDADDMREVRKNMTTAALVIAGITFVGGIIAIVAVSSHK